MGVMWSINQCFSRLIKVRDTHSKSWAHWGKRKQNDIKHRGSRLLISVAGDEVWDVCSSTNVVMLLNYAVIEINLAVGRTLCRSLPAMHGASTKMVWLQWRYDRQRNWNVTLTQMTWELKCDCMSRFSTSLSWECTGKHTNLPLAPRRPTSSEVKEKSSFVEQRENRNTGASHRCCWKKENICNPQGVSTTQGFDKAERN